MRSVSVPTSKGLFVAITSSLVLMIGAATSCASIEVGDHVKLYNGVGSPGGVFHVDDLNDPGVHNLDTFCVEITEYIGFAPAEYVVDFIGTKTNQGGKELGEFSAWLYTGYLNGSLLTPAERTVGTKMNALQVGIWEGMGYTASEISGVIGSNFDATLLADFHTAFASSGWSGIGDIRVMSLRTLSGGYAQDQVFRAAPEPFSIAVWLLLAVCVGAPLMWKRWHQG